MLVVRSTRTFTVILSIAVDEVIGCHASEVSLRPFPESGVFNYRNTSMNETNIREKVREHYAGVAEGKTSCCPRANSGCGEENISQKLGYSAQDVASLPEQAEMGLGCGNPISFAKLRPGEVVVDLGSGGGVDCFLASKEVGPTGSVIGVDMTPQMLAKARKNADLGGYTNVEFRLGEIENLPVANHTADVVISNCVINLSTDKRRVYGEAFRVLKNGGRFAVADMVTLAPLPETLKKDVAAYTGCISGAASVEEVKEWLAAAGFEHVDVHIKRKSSEFIRSDADSKLDDYVASADITAWKSS
ncbi:MAG: arsenite methyltransferase [Verrucomicrobiota bacterium]|jgi:arsenite methyltransferase